jgi:coenzyme F420 biosynthesis associated uncharacterized protein
MSRPAPPLSGGAVDWQFAGAVGARLARPGPPTTDYTRAQVIDDLAEASRRAEAHVREVTGLSVDGPARDARIIDRREWIRAAANSLRVMAGGGPTPGTGAAGFGPAVGSGPGLRVVAGGGAGLGAGLGAVTGRLAGAQTGAVLAFVSAGILGQFDPFTADGGDLLLVYPNVIAAERQLRVPPRDFRLWVCLHEVTHRVQFTANPWLSRYMADTLAVVTAGRDDDVLEVAGRLAGLLRERAGMSGPGGSEAGPTGVIGVLRAMLAEPQRDALDRLLVLGTLLEGHADHVMDAVGPAVVPSVHLIRRRFDDRRHRPQPPLQRVLRALLGIDAKLSQYTRGKAFVDEVVARAGMAGFNTVWSGPDALPLPNEIENPALWVDRVL